MIYDKSTFLFLPETFWEFAGLTADRTATWTEDVGD